jgi:hypothetical protein
MILKLHEYRLLDFLIVVLDRNLDATPSPLVTDFEYV